MPQAVIHLLDPGAVKYGDSILCNVGQKWILVDGARSTSTRATSSTVLGAQINHRPLQDQIAAKRGGMHVDLLVITHCHSDHVGCLPELIEDHGLTFDWALVADSQLGFGLGVDEDLPDPDAMSDEMKLRLALREEPLRDGTDEEIAQFILDSASEYNAYRTLLESIEGSIGERMVVYKGPSEAESPGLDALLAAFTSAELRVLGPTQDQLLLCSEALTGRATDAEESIGEVLAGSNSLVNAYRELLGRESDALADDPDGDNGNAVNCQSIILSLGAGGKRFLLTGDMQFTRTYLGPDVDDEMEAMLAAIEADGPYNFVKLSHHGATNGQNEGLLRSWGAKRLAISTGSRSNQHPTPATLDALRRLKPDGFRWIRTDMNGICTYKLSDSGTGSLSKERGFVNDDTEAANRDSAGVEVRPAPVTTTALVTGSASGNVEVTIRIPNQKTRVSFTIEIDPGSGSKQGSGDDTFPFA